MTVLLKSERVLVFDRGVFVGYFFPCTEGIDYRPSVVHPVNPDFDTWYQAFRLLEK